MISRRHAFVDASFIALVIVASFGIFFYVLAQTATLASDCLRAGITDTVKCEEYLKQSSSGSSSLTDTTSVSNSITTVLCVDSDRGINTDVAGALTYGSQTNQDDCVETSVVREWFCADGKPENEDVECGAGMMCVDGACVVTPANTAVNTILDPTQPDTTNETGAAVDSATDSGSNTTGEQTTQPINEPTDIVAPPYCSDSDDGNEPTQRGEVTDGKATLGDSCLDAYTVREFFCDAGIIRSEPVKCSSDYVCLNGACIKRTTESSTAPTGTGDSVSAVEPLDEPIEDKPEEPVSDDTADVTAPTSSAPAITCGDSDGGESPVIRGSVIVNGVGYLDRCIGASVLEENYCDGGKRIVEVMSCGSSQVCREGACISVAPATTIVAPAPTAVAEVDKEDDTLVRDTAGEVVGTESLDDGDDDKPFSEDSSEAERESDFASDEDSTAELPERCKLAGVFDESDCRELIAVSYLPQTCVGQGVTDPYACKLLMLEESGLPASCEGLDAGSCWRMLDAGDASEADLQQFDTMNEQSLPADCRASGADDLDDCFEQYDDEYLADECREASIYTAAGCDKFLFERARREQLDDATLPDACRAAGISDAMECKAYLLSMNYPEACRSAKITDLEVCAEFVIVSSIPEECRRAGVVDSKECEDMLWRRHMEPACAAEGITDRDECAEHGMTLVGEDAVCLGLTTDECHETMKQRHVGALMSAQEANDKTERMVEELAGETGLIDLMKFKLLGADESMSEALDVLPIDAAAERRFRVIPSEAQLGIDAEDAIVNSAGMLLAYDSDGDGVPDDVEVRLGTNPKQADSDDDGVGDRDELAARGSLSGIDRALVNGREIGQPLLQGVVDAALTVRLGDAPGEERPGTRFRGTGLPGEIITIYVYSELPVVLTTAVDENGQWTFEMADSLKDGEHEVYVALNDDDGSVTRKSEPFGFLVRGAIAATAADVAAEAALIANPLIEAQTAPQSDMRAFAVAGVLLVLLALGLAAAVVMKKPSQTV